MNPKTDSSYNLAVGILIRPTTPWLLYVLKLKLSDKTGSIKKSNVANFFILVTWIIFNEVIQNFFKYITYHLFIELSDANASEIFPRIAA